MSSTTDLARFAQANDLPPPLKSVVSDGDEQEFLYSSDKVKRYAYRRSWLATAPHVLWVMLNPGTGETEQRRRNTMERCISWSKQWGFGGLYFGNVFAERSKSAKQLLPLATQKDELNEKALRFLVTLSTEVVVAWGATGSRFNRSSAVAALLPPAKCLGSTKSGEPRHPLYVSASVPLQPWHIGGQPPNPSIERTASGLRPPAAAHVER